MAGGGCFEIAFGGGPEGGAAFGVVGFCGIAETDEGGLFGGALGGAVEFAGGTLVGSFGVGTLAGCAFV